MIFSQFCTYSRYRVINSFAISLDICGVYFPSILHFVYVIIMEKTKRGKTSSSKAVGPKPKRQRWAKSSAERAAETPVPVNHRDRMITLCCLSKWSLTSGENRLHPNFSANIHSFERSYWKVYFQLKKRKSIFFPLNVHGNFN